MYNGEFRNVHVFSIFSSDFLEFKRGKREERKKRLEESVAQKKELYIKSSPSSGPKIDKFLSPLNYD